MPIVPDILQDPIVVAALRKKEEFALKWGILKDLLASSRPQKSVDAIIVFSRSHEPDGQGLLELAIQLWENSPFVTILINGSDGRSKKDAAVKAWPGWLDYNLRLIKSVPALFIMKSTPALDTQHEAVEFVKVIAEKKWTNVAVINLVTHLPRCMNNMLCELRKLGLDKKVKMFPAAPTSTDYLVEVNGQQGSPPQKRVRQCAGEFARMQSYPVEYPENFVNIDMLISYLVKLRGDYDNP